MTTMELETASQSTVFVIDDDTDIRQSLRRLLEEVNLHVEEFGSAQDFLTAHGTDTPGCMILDIRMPEMSGIELQKTMLRRSARGHCWAAHSISFRLTPYLSRSPPLSQPTALGT